MRKNKLFPTWVVLLLVLAIIAYRNFRPGNITEDQVVENESLLVRDPSTLIFTHHAKCRMNCRRIDSAEVAEILVKGKINANKSDLANPSDLKYALEGRSADNQKIRIIIAPENNGMVVVTVIDLEKDWKCDC